MCSSGVGLQCAVQPSNHLSVLLSLSPIPQIQNAVIQTKWAIDRQRSAASPVPREGRTIPPPLGGAGRARAAFLRVLPLLQRRALLRRQKRCAAGRARQAQLRARPRRQAWSPSCSALSHPENLHTLKACRDNAATICTLRRTAVREQGEGCHTPAVALQRCVPNADSDVMHALCHGSDSNAFQTAPCAA